MKSLKELIKGILVICSYFIIQVILTMPFIFLLEDNKISINQVYLIVFLGSALIYLAIYHKSIIENLKDFKKNRKKILKSTFKYWIIGLVIMITSSYIIGLLNIPSNVNQDTNIELFKQGPILQSICAIVLAPIIEELVFRRSFKNFTNNKYIFGIVTGLIFGLVHVTSSITSPNDLIMLIYLIPYSSVGIALGIAYKENNNIVGTTLMHSIHNLISVIEILILL